MDWKSFFDRLGMNGTRWQWRIIRWQKWWEEKTSRAESAKPQISQQHKFCHACNALLERDDTTCIRCGAKAQSWRGQAARRKLAVAMPTACPVSGGVLFFIIVVAMLRLAPEWNNTIAYAGAYYRHSGEFWRWISYAYLHGDLLHLAFNGFALIQVGPLVEQQIRGARTFVVYTLTALTAVLGFCITGGQGHLVGASGSLFGLIGFGVAFNHFYGGYQGTQMRGFYLQWAMYGIIFGLVAGSSLRIANSAHVGGLIGGLVLGWIIERDMRQPHRFEKAWNGAAIFCALLTLTALGLMFFRAFGP